MLIDLIFEIELIRGGKMSLKLFLLHTRSVSVSVSVLVLKLFPIIAGFGFVMI